jgi:KUP system potassium uptake protein
MPGVGVVMTSTAASIPPVLLNMVRRFRTLHRTVLLTTVTTEEIPHVVGDRASVEQLGDGLHRVILRYGFMDEPHVHRALEPVVAEIEPNADPTDLTYVLGQERVIPGAGGQMGRASETIFAALSRNAANPSDFFELPPAQVVEVGSRIDL